MKIYKYLIVLTIGLVAFSCDPHAGGPSAEDHFMNQPIAEAPIDADYIVGASYRSFEWNENVPETPVAGKYDSENGDPVAYEKHVQQAATGGIDYFLFTLRSSVNMDQFKADSTFISNNHKAPNAAQQNFAISYNFGSMDLSDGNRIEDKELVPTFLEDFKLMLPYFEQSNYMLIDGKAVVRIENGHNLFSNDNAALYNTLRAFMSNLGVELYIIANQQEWTPPARYDFRFIDGVDAVSHNSYVNISESWYDRYIQFHKMAEQAWTYSSDFFESNGLEYAPTISPSINPQISNSGSNNYAFPKDAEWFADICNNGRLASGSRNLILLDSFNDWNAGKQIEAADSYGDEYLNILKQQFKLN
jgi:hypothetical protein